MRTWLKIALWAFVGLFVGFGVGRLTAPPPIIEERVERDTITLRYVAPTSIAPTRIEVADLPLLSYPPEHTRDTTYIHDTIRVAVPLSLYTFEAPDFRAEVEGFGVTLKQIEIFPETIYRTTIVKEPTRWGVGVQLGVGLSKNGFTPYLGVGVQCNLWTW